MKTSRLITLMSVATIASALLLPAVASAHGRSDRWHPSHEERWTPPSKYAARDHHRHDKWSKRYGKGHGKHYKGRTKIYVDGPRRPPRLVHREPPARLHLGNGLTIIYR
ncbi:hypothetical protein G3480_05665 [Thiorhodococcus mannitoliphagus]|uniref:RcnB family protein n=1 Tax=Thiorhodococcus mannitoliphagus TaxID=329406 RepID=A0A6P1DVU9_9GAMM|nr:hypothetical protein [Thiorhodococcus mannitoliphagus]NEX19804.1 hypothetical protein [Thiorhodococcus mannitoliphagus]